VKLRAITANTPHRLRALTAVSRLDRQPNVVPATTMAVEMGWEEIV